MAWPMFPSILGRGLARRLEVAVEVAEAQHAAGLGRWLLTGGAQAGTSFRPVGSEALFL